MLSEEKDIWKANIEGQTFIICNLGLWGKTHGQGVQYRLQKQGNSWAEHWNCLTEISEGKKRKQLIGRNLSLT